MAKLQLKFAVAAREENRYHTLDEREVAPLKIATPSRRTGVVKVDQAPPIVLEPVPELEAGG